MFKRVEAMQRLTDDAPCVRIVVALIELRNWGR
jgi:hypothetical protein